MSSLVDHSQLTAWQHWTSYSHCQKHNGKDSAKNIPPKWKLENPMILGFLLILFYQYIFLTGLC